MKRIFGVALLVLPLLAGSAHASGWPFNVQAGGSFYVKGGPGPAYPQAGPWYLYWPLEAHFVAPAPTGYPYWPAPQGLPNMSIGGPTCPPGVPVPPVAPVRPPFAAVPPPFAAVPPPPVAAAPPVTAVPIPAVQTTPQPAAQPIRPATPPANPRIQLPPYLQPTSYYPAVYSGQPPSYWYDR